MVPASGGRLRYAEVRSSRGGVGGVQLISEPPSATFPCVPARPSRHARSGRSRTSMARVFCGRTTPHQAVSMSTFVASTSRRGARRQGFVLWLLAAALVAVACGGWWWFSRRDARPDGYNIVLHEVERDDFSLDVTERGEIESAGVTEVISEVKTKN